MVRRDGYLTASAEPPSNGARARLSYRHKVCGAMTTMSKNVRQDYVDYPKLYPTMLCNECGRHYPIAEFRWVGARQL